MKKIPSTFNCKALLGLENFERIRQDRALAGICTSISVLTGITVLKIRLLVITLLALDSSGGIFFFYLLFWLIIPLREKPLLARVEKEKPQGADALKTVSMLEVYKDK